MNPPAALPCLSELARLYGVAFTGIEPITAGVNTTARVTSASGTFYLRLYRPKGRSADAIAYEIDLVRHLHNQPGFDVSIPVSQSDGNFFSDWHGGAGPRKLCLFSPAKGRELNRTKSDIDALAGATAALHRACLGASLSAERFLYPKDICARSLAALNSVNTHTRQMAAELAPFAEAIPELINAANLIHAPCHGDLWAGNARISDGRVTFFDFDECGTGPLMLDLGTLAWHLSQEESPEAEEGLQSFLETYVESGPLPPSDLDMLPHFIVLAQFRSLLFLARYCVLADDLWQDVARRNSLLLSARTSDIFV